MTPPLVPSFVAAGDNSTLASSAVFLDIDGTSNLRQCEAGSELLRHEPGSARGYSAHLVREVVDLLFVSQPVRAAMIGRRPMGMQAPERVAPGT